MDGPKIEIIDPKGDVIIVSVKEKDDPSDSFTTLFPSHTREETRFKVSSNFLTQSSDYFKARLGQNWPEGQELSQKGNVEIRIDGFEREGVRIVLNILHWRNDQIPLQVDLALLTKVALVTDSFQCNQALCFMGKKWFFDCCRWCRNIKRSPEYVFVCHVFGIKDDLEDLISRFWKEANAPFDPGNLPIPSSITDQINAKLETFHDDLVTNIGKQVIQNLRELPKEGYTCDSLRLGFWAKGKRSSLISKRKLETPKSISHLIHELNDNAKHTCTEGRQGDCPNFQKLLG